MSDVFEYLKKTNISYVSKKIRESSEVNANLIDELENLFDAESVDAPFCTLGDFDLNDFENELPDGWSLRREKIDLKPGEAMVVLAVIDYSAKRNFDVEDYEDVEIVAYDVGGIYPLSVESEEDPFMEDYQTSASDKQLLFNICWKDGSVDNLSCSKADFSESCIEWKTWLDELN